MTMDYSLEDLMAKRDALLVKIRDLETQALLTHDRLRGSKYDTGSLEIELTRLASSIDRNRGLLEAIEAGIQTRKLSRQSNCPENSSW